ncbi:DUF6632 domain-containing protein [Mycobacterium intracellulare]|uniref:DUF6632 domain-containing protein n=1 Tax=Mycobacterium intracellulare TaxID=1767 RepID=UPI00109E3959|nr:DUF6632 domain-containing protein [Mycobacterium intracellulare]
MSDDKNTTRSLTPARVALVVIGLFFIFGIYPQAQLWPSAWKWGHGSSHYPAMLLGIYATLGVFLLIAARDPLAHRSLIWFTVVSSIVHAGIMAAEALGDPAERGHFMGDVPVFLAVAVVLSLVMPRAPVATQAKTPF